MENRIMEDFHSERETGEIPGIGALLARRHSPAQEKQPQSPLTSSPGSGAPAARPIKAIIQVPCYNEEETLGIALGCLPRTLPGIDQVEWLIINDGSHDGTMEVARRHGVDHIVDLGFHQGLAKGFMAGLHACLQHGADIIINTDADNQYCAADIPKLIAPILRGEAQIVVGERPITSVTHFSPLKKALQKLGSKVVRIASGTEVADAPSGFRAISRNAAMQLNVFSKYTYTLETIIQAGRKNIPIRSVPVRVNGFLRPSRLMKSMRAYVQRSILTILRILMTYRPMWFFNMLGVVPLTAGIALGVRWCYLYTIEPTRSHVPSLILAAVAVLVGVQLCIFALVADIISINRALLEDIQLRARRQEYGGPTLPS